MEPCLKTAHATFQRGKRRKSTPVPLSSFTSYMDEGMMHLKKMSHRKAKFCFDRALEMRPNDPLALTLRSICCMNLGLHDQALADAEHVGELNAHFIPGLYQLGEILFALGFFEKALIRFHQGQRYRKGFSKFYGGIVKCEAAIRQAILDRAGTQIEDINDILPLLEEIEHESNPSNFQCCIRSISAEALRENYVPLLKPQNLEREKWVTREILGNLASHKFFAKRILAKLTSPQMKIRSSTVPNSFAEILFFLQHHENLLRWMKPMYVRKYGLNFNKTMVLRYEVEALAQRKFSRKLLKDAAEGAILKNIMQIEHALSIARNSDAQLEAERSLRQLKKVSLSQVPRKYEFMMDMMHYRAIALLRQRMFDQAADAFRKEIKLAQQHNSEPVASRSLDFLGRTHALAGRFNEAIEAWEGRLEHARTSLERAYTFHEIGRANLELSKKEMARYYATEALNLSQGIKSPIWVIFCRILLAQIELKNGNLAEAKSQFEEAVQVATTSEGNMQMAKLVAAIIQCLRILMEKQVNLEQEDSDINEEDFVDYKPTTSPAEPS